MSENKNKLILFHRKCKNPDICAKEVIREVAYCYTEGSFCQTWIDGNVHKVVDTNKPIVSATAAPVLHPPPQSNAIAARPQTNALRPYRAPTNSQQQRDTSSSSNVMTNEVLGMAFGNNHHHQPPQPEINNYKCGLPTVRNKPKHRVWNMVRILGGKSARKGQWPWQVVILNRYKVYLHRFETIVLWKSFKHTFYLTLIIFANS